MKKAPAIVLLILGSINAMAIAYAYVEGLRSPGKRRETDRGTGSERK